MAEGGIKGGRASVEIDGKRVPLNTEGIGKAGGNKVVEAIRAAIERGIDGD